MTSINSRPTIHHVPTAPHAHPPSTASGAPSTTPTPAATPTGLIQGMEQVAINPRAQHRTVRLAPPTPRETYSQTSDSTLQPFLRTGQEMIGQAAHDAQMAGRTPHHDDVRVPAHQSGLTVGGAGLHEIVPTNRAGQVARAPDNIRESLAQTMSGARTSTSATMFRTTADGGNPEVGGHTNTFRHGGTRGQAPAHDRLRTQIDTSITSASASAQPIDPRVTVAQMTAAQINATASGPEIMRSNYITGMTPNLILHNTQGVQHGSVATGDYERPLEPPTAASTPNRSELAANLHNRREVMKENHERLVQEIPVHQRADIPPVSPRRSAMTPDGRGGDYEPQAALWARETPQMRPQHQAADAAAWVTRPMRLEPTPPDDSGEPPTKRARIN
ncbi:hypothetical protein AACH06_04020 [Ideonella sp. DXS29W]|uniref:Uncharacterized protein n=1 Tax=Ideonella lacteola TaxID=2984193 RepID=A0ABU9BJ34_9BURK